MRRRLRPAHDTGTLSELYGTVAYDHTLWKDHRDRVLRTIDFADYTDANSIADLTAGDGAIPLTIARNSGLDSDHVILGDYSKAWDYDYTGPIEETIHRITPVDLFICSEALEHLDDPDTVLANIRAKTKTLLLSTPCNETRENEEHYWTWGISDIALMLESAGFTPYKMSQIEYPQLDVRYQLWMAR